jgi:transcriptional regulator of acetoin/glycerol metabolism
MEGIDSTTHRKDSSPPRFHTTDKVLSLGELRDHLAEELARAHRYARPLTVVELSLDGLDPNHRSAAATLVSQHVRRQDTLGWSADQRIVAVLPETTAEGAIALARRLVGALTVVASGARAALASCPADGAEADALLARTSTILEGSEAGQITAATPLRPHAPATSTRTFRPIDEEVRELERARMKEALDAASGNQTRAATLIGMPLRTFVSKLRVYGLPTGGRKRKTPLPPASNDPNDH